MKILAVILIAISTSVSACKQEEPTHKLITSQPSDPVSPHSSLMSNDSKEKQVCITVYDSKEKQNIEKCRTVKIYKKHDGTPIPKQ